MVYDAIIVGAGPGGSSAATFLAQRGLSILLLDKADFPRDKVCGDGLTPQAIFWLDILGCVDEVLSQTNSCITSADLYVNGEYLLTGRFPQDTQYPGFGTCLERKKLDYVLVRNAVAHGAVFRPRHLVQKLFWLDDSIAVEAKLDKKAVRFEGKLLIGADGANSVVSRSIGNAPRDGTTAISLRTYYQGAQVDMSPMRIYFNEQFFPGYGWVFVDDSGKANIGIGYASDKNFPMKHNLKKTLNDFIQTDLKKMLRGATPIGQPAGWWACFFKPKSIVTDRVMLIGDAANLADPMNGGGIHKAMESAYTASQVAIWAIASGDCSQQTLSRYEKLWNERAELDWRTAELFLSIIKNPNLRELYLFLLKTLGRLTAEDQRFQDFCSGIFSGVTPQSAFLSPLVLFDVVPFDPGVLFSIFRTSNGVKSQSPLNLATSAARNTLKMTGRVVTSPLKNLDWGVEISTKTLSLMECYLNKQITSIV